MFGKLLKFYEFNWFTLHPFWLLQFNHSNTIQKKVKPKTQNLGKKRIQLSYGSKTVILFSAVLWNRVTVKRDTFSLTQSHAHCLGLLITWPIFESHLQVEERHHLLCEVWGLGRGRDWDMRALGSDHPFTHSCGLTGGWLKLQHVTHLIPERRVCKGDHWEADNMSSCLLW